VPAADLVQKLDETVARYPAVLGVQVAAYEWQSDGRFSIWSKTGWKAVLGHLDTVAQRDAIGTKLSYLAALKGTLNFVEPNFGYLDLESPATPTAGGTPGLPQAITTALTEASIPLTSKVPAPPAKKPAPAKKVIVAPAPSAQPGDARPAVAAPAPTAAATPTPFTFYLPPPKK
jgi:hypothetical protein